MTNRRGSKSRRRRPRRTPADPDLTYRPPVAAPKPGDEGIARWRGYTFRAKVLCYVTGRDGPAISVAATCRAAWHSLPAGAVLVRHCDFRPMPRLHTHADLREAGIENPDVGRECALCGCDVPSGYKQEHGAGVCMQSFTHGTPAGRTTAATDTTLVDALERIAGPRVARCTNRRVHKMKLAHVLGETVGGVHETACGKSDFHRTLHDLWSEVTCPECLALRPPEQCPYCGQRHGSDGAECVAAR